ncbi:MAG: TRAP transporter small permease [bacterium]
MKSGQRLLEEWLLSVILTAQVALVCAGVLSRYFFSWSLSFTEELTRYLLIWLACLGLPACWARGEMIGFQWPGRRSPRTERALSWLRFGAGWIFFAMLFYSAAQMIRLQWQYDQRTSVMGWPVVWVSLALPAASILFGIRAVQAIRNRNADPEED